jgi:DNA polymerase III sliding clamp (beta) subunit (PCNA family)
VSGAATTHGVLSVVLKQSENVTAQRKDYAMKVTFPRRALESALAEISTSAGHGDSQSNPVEAALAVTVADGGRTTLTGVSKERSIEARHVGTLRLADAGAFAVPRDHLEKIVGVLTGDHVELSVTDSLVTVRSGTAEYTLPTVTDVHFDAVEADTTAVATLNGGQLATAIKQLKTAIQMTKLNALVQIHKVGNQVRIAASDGYRLVFVHVPTTEIAEFEDILVPFRIVTAGISYLASHNDSISFVQDHATLTAIAGPATVRIRQQEGPFADVDTLMASLKFNKSITVNCKELIGTIDRILVVAYDSPAIVVEVTDGQLSVRLQTKTVGKAIDTCSATTTAQDGTSFSVNGRFLSAALLAAESETATIELSDPSKPLRIRGEFAGYETIVMTLRPA